MEASPQPGVDDLLAEVVRAVEVVDGIEVAGGAVGVEPVDVDVDPVGAQELGEDLGER